VGAGLSKRLTGVILAGGRGARLGGVAKGLLEVGGRRMIDRVAAALEPAVDEVLLSANAADAASWLADVRVVPDALAGGGSAAGIHAAIRASTGPVFVVGWDLPFITERLIRTLVAAAAGREGEIDAVVAAGPRGGMVEPLCGWYGPACREQIEGGWASGDRSIHGLLSRVRTIIVPLDVVASIGPPGRLFFNVNSPDDLATARAMAQGE
jgi:molybdopterin-guanine dinucleotide biosynthesis protein A